MKTEADIIKDAIDLWQDDMDKEAIELLMSCNLEINAEANTIIGQIYLGAEKGRSNIKKALKQGIEYLERGLNLGDSEAGRILANEFYLGGKPNFEKAERFWLKALELDDELAAFELANFYYSERNDKILDAIAIYKELIKKDEFVQNCFTKLGRIFLKGKGVKPNADYAKKYLKKGANYGSAVCYRDLAFEYYQGKLLGMDKDEAIKYMKMYHDASEDKFNKEQARLIIEAMKADKDLFRN